MLKVCKNHSSLTSKGYRPHVHETRYFLAFEWLQVARSGLEPIGPRAVSSDLQPAAFRQTMVEKLDEQLTHMYMLR